MSNRNQGPQDANDNPVPRVSTPHTEASESIHETKDSHKPQSESAVYKKIVAFFTGKNSHPNIANLISLGMLIITGILAYYTWKVFNQTTIQTQIAGKSADAAKISADAAKKSADLQKQALDSQVSAKKQSDISDGNKTKRDIATFDLQKKALDKQIASLQETQKEFKIENKTFPQIMDIKVDTLAVNKDVWISYRIVAVGKQPIKIVKNIMGVIFSKDPPKTDFSKVNYSFEKAGIYLMAGENISDKASMVASNDFINNVISGKGAMFVIGTIYFDDINDKMLVYKYNIRIQIGAHKGTLLEAITDTIFPYNDHPNRKQFKK